MLFRSEEESCFGCGNCAPHEPAPVARKPTPKDLAKAKPTKTAEKEAKILMAKGQGKLVIVAKANVSVANTDRRIISHEGSAAQAASAKVQLLRHSQALAGNDAGFISH